MAKARLSSRHKQKPLPGQRWVSDSEPELGLGIILSVEGQRVEILFSAAAERRQYAIESAPLRRVHFKAGDRIRTHDGRVLIVDAVIAEGDLLQYRAGEVVVTEAELADSISFSKPEDRLLGGQIDSLALYRLRAEALNWRTRIRKSPVRGFPGGRVDLIPHQLYIANEVTSRLTPRVLLADEVGLGKTIEACLILRRLYLTGRVQRVLILVPESLCHQWFIELFRRFSLKFDLYDEERCRSLQEVDSSINPFLDSQLILCDIDFIADSAERTEQAVAAGFDLLIVDEAHHMEWHPQEPGARYQAVEKLAEVSPALLLLTATPQQLGPESHFARLRLLDPERYADLDTFLAESEQYEAVADAVERLMRTHRLSAADQRLFAERSAQVQKYMNRLAVVDPAATEALITELLDTFGTGRVMFRNTRAVLSGFPERKAHLYPLEKTEDQSEPQSRIHWLIQLLEDLGSEKVLLICRTAQQVQTIAELLQKQTAIKVAIFNEQLTLMQRDRAAAWFAEEDGARILLCSEIGSEGRNFQFAHHLVLYDLPQDPERLEQRIGRLDRIGQTSTIHIHIPYEPGTASEVLVRWYHEGLGAFEENLHGAHEIATRLKDTLTSLLEKFDAAALKRFIAQTRKEKRMVAEKLERGYDRLLAWSSSRKAEAGEIIARIQAIDNDTEFERFFLDMMDQFGLHVDEHSERSYVLRPGHAATDTFPDLPEEGMTLTFDRRKALAREDIHFFSWDHPLIRSAMDVLLSSESGNTSFALWPGCDRQGIVLEVQTVIECVAPPALHMDRFLPATAIRTIVDHSLQDLTAELDLDQAPLEEGDPRPLIAQDSFKRHLLPKMLDASRKLVDKQRKEWVAAARAVAEKHYANEIERLENLQQVNDHVRPEEVAQLKARQDAVLAAFDSTHLRTDALRLVWMRE